MSDKAIPKSLHTVTVLVAVARSHLSRCANVTEAVTLALELLGYPAGACDPYGLRMKAIKAMEAQS